MRPHARARARLCARVWPRAAVSPRHRFAEAEQIAKLAGEEEAEARHKSGENTAAFVGSWPSSVALRICFALQAARRIAEVEEELAAAEAQTKSGYRRLAELSFAQAAAAAAEESSSEDPEMASRAGLDMSGFGMFEQSFELQPSHR